MGFIAKAFKGPDMSAQNAAAAAQLDEVRKANELQKKTIADEATRVKATEDGMMRAKSVRRGLLAYTEDQKGLNNSLGG